MPPEPEISHLVTEDDAPMDNFASEKPRADWLAERLRALGVDPDE